MKTTTLEESKRLIELGLRPETADCFWSKQLRDWRGKEIKREFHLFHQPWKEKNHMVMGFEEFEDYPAWSLDALLDVLPADRNKSWQITRGGWEFLEESGSYDRNAYFVSLEVDGENLYQSKVAGSFLDAAYNMVTWILANGIKL